jgi:hypothetical protein
MTFDFVAHDLVILASDGTTEAIPLEPRSVMAFYKILMDTLRRMGLETRIWPMPVEIPDPVRFDTDAKHHSYDPQAANAFWRILVTIKPIFENFRCGFIGKSSPVHFFWGSFDLASTRFSGRLAPERPGADAITKESYSHEVISHGFWPGAVRSRNRSSTRMRLPSRRVSKKPPSIGAAFYSKNVGILLPYEAVRNSSSPESDRRLSENNV